VYFVVRTVDALKFAIEWKKKTLETGGLKWKKEYRDRMFKELYGAELERHTGTHRTNIEKTLKGKFVRKHEKVVTGRYQLLELYKTVRLFTMVIHDILTVLVWCRHISRPYMGPKCRSRGDPPVSHIYSNTGEIN
jgi:hypothetical protein